MEIKTILHMPTCDGVDGCCGVVLYSVFSFFAQFRLDGKKLSGGEKKVGA